MKKFLLLLLIPLFLGACTKNNDVIPGPDPGPDPDPTSYKATISVTFNVPGEVTLVIDNAMWVLDDTKEQLTNRIEVFQPTTTIVLTGDTVKNNLDKTVYLYFIASRVIGRIPHAYTIRKSFILKENVSLTFDVPIDKENIEIIDP